jgi:hypothetical protein
MRMRWKMTLMAGVATAMFAIAYAELVADIRTPRSSLTEMHAVGSSISIQMDDFRRAGEAMKAKYGPSAQTSLHTPGANLTTVVDGKVVEEGKLPASRALTWGVRERCCRFGRARSVSSFGKAPHAPRC